MKSKSKSYLALVSLLAFVLIPFDIQFNANYSSKFLLNNLESSAGFVRTFIHVDANWTDTTAYDWCYGQGTWQDPYIIENVTINCGSIGSGIFIENSKDDYFIIRNCTVWNSGSNSDDAGIKFVNVSRGTIFNNTCSYNGNDGILFYTDCDNNTIQENIANFNSNGGIYFETSCFENLILNNTVNQNVIGVMLTNTMPGVCHHNNIVNNTANENGVGIWLSQSNYNNVTGNRLFNNSKPTTGNGIRLTFYSWGGKSTNNIIKNNVISYSRYGIFMYDGDHNTISDNIITKNSIHGIYFQTQQTGFNCEYNTIANNTVNENGMDGINLLYLCRYNTLINNTIYDNKKNGISLQSTSDGNNITSNTIKSNLCGILLSSSDNNNVSENVLIDNGVCMYEDYCTGNIFENNSCINPKFQSPILIDDSATGEGANNWTWAESQPWCSGSGTLNEPYIIEDLTISGLGLTDGIEILNSDVYFIIRNCKIFDADAAIYLDTVNNSLLIENNCSNNGMGISIEYSNNNIFISNFLNNNDNSGVYLYDCNHTTIFNNTINGNYDGIYLDTDCSYNNITQNTVNNNVDGIYVYYRCNYNNITSNMANNNQYYGIYLEDCRNNQISNNIANNNTEHGILLEINSKYNFLSQNTVNDNQYGIRLSDGSNNNTISENVIRYNNQGITLDDICDFNNFSENIIYNNSLGVEIVSGNNNTFYLNFFLKNELHAIDNGDDNSWNSMTIGNYWDNHTGPDSSPQDGIVDTPYIFIGGTVGSIDYLPIAINTTVIINSPDSNDLFGNVAPNYDISITDPYLVEMWYTLDGGLHNYTFTEFTGMIDQSAWDLLNDGLHTLRFYASDKAGNIGYSELQIEKDTVAPSINIVSPALDAKFSSTPNFVVEISDANLDSMWYSLDGGVTNYSFTSNGTINSAAWAALSGGSVTIIFYANDTLGHLASQSVTLIKSIPSGFDPILLTVIIGSIAGGVVIVAGIYIFMRKRSRT